MHFPIGLLVVALFLEALTLNKKRPGLREGICWMVYLGALFAVLSAGLGWLLGTYDDYSGELLQNHRNLGIATAVLSAITALVLQKTRTGKISNYLPYRSTLTLSVISLTVTGHLGASLTHGEDFLASALPGNTEVYDDSKGVALLAQLGQLDTISETQLDDLNMEVRAIIAHNCYQCHSENKQKGELVLENKRGVFKGGKSGEIIVAGNPEKSELYRRISLSPDDDDVMPKKGKVLKNNEIALIKLWIKKGAHWSDRALKIFPEAELSLSKPALPEATGEAHPVDKFMAVYFKKKDIDWPESVDDKTFLRRAYLDIVGLLPEPVVLDRFESDKNPNKRNKLIDTLLNDDQNYTQNWLSFWNDLLRNDYSGTGFITGGRKQITDWLYKSLLENKPYNAMIKELINPSLESEGFIKGIQWRGLVNSSQRTEMQAAQNIGQSLMGVNVKCASCHNSFVSNLTLEQTYGFASIFADSVMELNRCDIPLGKMAEVNFLYPELGSVDADNVQERLWQLSEIIVKPENGRLYRTIANRIWQRLLGRGIIEPVDTMDNTPWDSDLLDWLAADLIDSNYDLKQLIRTIMTSKTYQLPTVNYENLEEIKSAKYVFKGPVIRRMSAEQFSDAVSQIVSPLFYAAAYNPFGESLSANRIWHREIKFDRDVLPEPGKRYFRHKFTLADKEIIQAKALISVDHSYVLYLNSQKVGRGSNWRKVDKLDVAEFLIPGENTIAIEGTNEGNIANPAGVLFAMKINQRDSLETLLQSAEDEGWKSTDVRPANAWIQSEFDDGQWKSTKNYGSKDWDMLLNFTFEDNVSPFARASLVRQHPFMKALGRPSRENVTTTRDDRATLLQALELTNGAYFNQVLEEGAIQWLEEYHGNSETIVETLYAKSLGRKPTAKEKDIMLGALGNNPTKESVEDLFWATLLTPEFQFIY
ncbi:DUF1553 domain-containing protein [Flavobacteriaceae bacterium F89]|uniref:DUF1553 domain-containing protein n=1 Tax=Cerina litoralis TaxID=2874477 RepID=A0AAE3ETD7_9FLAO|nr:DUF1553 domain-containing protein [Cerina litoralis]